MKRFALTEETMLIVIAVLLGISVIRCAARDRRDGEMKQWDRLDKEAVRLEEAFRKWDSENLHRDFSPCRGCRAKPYQPHALDCRYGAPMETHLPALIEAMCKQCGQKIFLDMSDALVGVID
jgi:hypothetical protein